MSLSRWSSRSPRRPTLVSSTLPSCLPWHYDSALLPLVRAGQLPALARDSHFVPEAAVQVDPVAGSLARGGVANVGVQRMAVVRRL